MALSTCLAVRHSDGAQVGELAVAVVALGLVVANAESLVAMLPSTGCQALVCY